MALHTYTNNARKKIYERGSHKDLWYERVYSTVCVHMYMYYTHMPTT